MPETKLCNLNTYNSTILQTFHKFLQISRMPVKMTFKPLPEIGLFTVVNTWKQKYANFWGFFFDKMVMLNLNQFRWMYSFLWFLFYSIWTYVISIMYLFNLKVFICSTLASSWLSHVSCLASNAVNSDCILKGLVTFSSCFV